ncbi:hypothetical protein DOY81_009442 [Sarcophaga bullata]|nr:hypothetical protein DOY81_009442 [Sarcophaga bullata]
MFVEAPTAVITKLASLERKQTFQSSFIQPCVQDNAPNLPGCAMEGTVYCIANLQLPLICTDTVCNISSDNLGFLQYALIGWGCPAIIVFAWSIAKVYAPPLESGSFNGYYNKLRSAKYTGDQTIP